MDQLVERELGVIAERLDAGLYVNNLHEIRNALGTVVRRSSGAEQLATWVVESVVADLCAYWDDRRLPSTEYEDVSSALTPPLRGAVDGLLGGCSATELQARLQRLVACFVDLQVAGAITSS